MIRRYLGNYNSFTCTAGQCPDTCCSGWMIEIDDASLEKYALLKDTNFELFNNKIDWTLDTFIRRENGDCSFLREDGLCQLQRTLGEETLCMTCDKYPRHMEEFPGVREYSLSISCPAVAEDFVALSETISFAEESDVVSDNDDYPDFNELVYNKLIDLRQLFFQCLKSNNVPFERKCAGIHSVLVDVQEHLDFGQWANCDENAPKLISQSSGYQLSSLEAFVTFRTLEPLRDGFIQWTRSIEGLVALADTAAMTEFRSSIPWLELLKTNLCYYFIYTYFCGSIYDDYVYAQGQQAIFNTQLIEYLLFGKWLENKKSLSKKEASEIIYKYSRELEHSNDNLILLEQLLDQANQ